MSQPIIHLENKVAIVTGAGQGIGADLHGLAPVSARGP